MLIGLGKPAEWDLMLEVPVLRNLDRERLFNSWNVVCWCLKGVGCSKESSS
jgi:hypothetical protein